MSSLSLHPHPRALARAEFCRQLSAALAVLAAAYAVGVLLLFGLGQAPDFGPNGFRLVCTPWAAWLIIALAVAVLLGLRDGPQSKRWSRALAYTVAGFGATFLLAHLAQWPSNPFDRLWFEAQLAAPHTTVLGRPSMVPSAGFLLYGLGVAWLDRPAWGPWRISELLMLVGLTPTYLGLVGYAFAAQALYPITQAVGAIAASATTWAYAFLSLSAALSRPQLGLVGVATSEDPGGVVLRRVLPATILLPMAVGMARLALDDKQEASLGFGPAVAMALTMLVPLGTVLSVALALNKAAEKAREARQTLHQQSQELSQRALELKEQSEALALARDQAVSAARAKSSFLSSVGHELRTPLNAILGYAELLEEDAKAEGRPEAKDLGRILHAAKGQLALVEEVLALSSLEQSVAKGPAEHLQLAHFLRDLGQPYAEKAAQKGLAFRWALAEGLPPVQLDPNALARLLRHLLANAVAYTSHGEVALVAQGDPKGWSLEVVDTGPGLPPERLADPAAAFAIHGNPDTHSGGLGVGLAMAHRLAEALGGKLSLSCPPEGGTRARFELLPPA